MVDYDPAVDWKDHDPTTPATAANVKAEVAALVAYVDALRNEVEFAAEVVKGPINSGASLSIDRTVASMWVVTLNAATPTLTLANIGKGESLTVRSIQDGTGGRKPTFAVGSGELWWEGDAAPTFTAAPGARDVFSFWSDDGINVIGAAGPLDLR